MVHLCVSINWVEYIPIEPTLRICTIVRDAYQTGNGNCEVAQCPRDREISIRACTLLIIQ